jgi:hypothetical protein
MDQTLPGDFRADEEDRNIRIQFMCEFSPKADRLLGKQLPVGTHQNFHHGLPGMVVS